MVTVLFRCPKCHIHSLHRITRSDDVLAFTCALPVRLSCWTCATNSLVVPKDRAIPANGLWDSFFGQCLRIADACGYRAREARNAARQVFFREQEARWLCLSQQVNTQQLVAIVGAAHSQLGPGGEHHLIAS